MGNKKQAEKDIPEREKAALILLFIVVFVVVVSIFQLASYIWDIEILAPFPPLNFIITLVVIILVAVIMHLLYKSVFYPRIFFFTNNLIEYIKKYPVAYKLIKFIYLHPFLSAIALGILGAIMSAFIRSLFE